MLLRFQLSLVHMTKVQCAQSPVQKSDSLYQQALFLNSLKRLICSLEFSSENVHVIIFM